MSWVSFYALMYTLIWIGTKRIGHLNWKSLPQGHLSISFCPIDPSGLVGVKVFLESDGSNDCQNSKVSLELLVEPNSIDIFKKYLATLAANQRGIAKLIAR